MDQYLVGYPMAFYDLETDPDQRANAMHNPGRAVEIKRLQEILMNHMVTTGDPQLENYKTILAGVPVAFKPSKKAASAGAEATANTWSSLREI